MKEKKEEKCVSKNEMKEMVINRETLLKKRKKNLLDCKRQNTKKERKKERKEERKKERNGGFLNEQAYWKWSF